MFSPQMTVKHILFPYIQGYVLCIVSLHCTRFSFLLNKTDSHTEWMNGLPFLIQFIVLSFFKFLGMTNIFTFILQKHLQFDSAKLVVFVQQFQPDEMHLHSPHLKMIGSCYIRHLQAGDTTKEVTRLKIELQKGRDFSE